MVSPQEREVEGLSLPKFRSGGPQRSTPAPSGRNGECGGPKAARRARGHVGQAVRWGGPKATLPLSVMPPWPQQGVLGESGAPTLEGQEEWEGMEPTLFPVSWGLSHRAGGGGEEDAVGRARNGSFGLDQAGFQMRQLTSPQRPQDGPGAGGTGDFPLPAPIPEVSLRTVTSNNSVD